MELFRTGEIIKPNFVEKRWIGFVLDAEQFKLTFTESVNHVMKEDRDRFDFVIDRDNKEFINQIYYYFKRDPLYLGDPNKGILLIGDIGCGKTFLMRVMFEMLYRFTNKIIIQVNAKNIQNEIEAKGLEYFRKRPMFIDDIGKEEKEIKVYGSAVRPFEDLLAFRYANKAVTFGTGNYKLESYEKMYTRHLSDRMKQLFNIHVLNGGSRR